MKHAAGKELAKHIIRPARVNPVGHSTARYGKLITIIYTLWKVLKVVAERIKGSMIDNGMILVCKEVLIKRIDLNVFHSYEFIPMVPCQ
jgi:hypothetical protein